MIRLQCPGCKKNLGVKDELAGRLVACPQCKAKIRVPQPEVDELEEVEDEPVESISTTPRPGRRPPPSRRRPADEDEDEPREVVKRSRRPQDDDEEEDDEEELPRPARKKKKRRVQRSASGGGMGGALIAGGVLGGICLVLVAVSFFVPALMLVPIGLGWLILLVGGIWFVVCAFQDDVVQGLLCMFVPFYSLIYLISHFEEVKKPFFVQLFGFVILMIGGCAGGIRAAKEGGSYNPRGQIEVPWIGRLGA